MAKPKIYTDDELNGLLDELVRGQFLDLPSIKRLSMVLPGDHDSIHLGRGQEFFDIRPYQPFEDRLSDIDIALSRRLGKLMSRIFFEEKELNVFLIADTSEQMIWGGKKTGKLTLLLKSAALIGLAVLQRMNALGSACPGFIQSFRQSRHDCGELLAFLRLVNKKSGKFSSGEIWKEFPSIIRLIKEPSIIIIFSDFFVEKFLLETVLSNLYIHDIIPVVIHSRHEHVLPLIAEGSFIDFSRKTEYSVDSDLAMAKQLFKEKIHDYEAKLRTIFLRFGVTNFIHVSDPETIFEDIFLGQHSFI